MVCPQAASHTDHWSVAIGLVLCLFCTHGRHQVAVSGTEAANAEPHPLPPSTTEKYGFAFLYGGVRLFWIKRSGGGGGGSYDLRAMRLEMCLPVGALSSHCICVGV